MANQNDGTPVPGAAPKKSKLKLVLIVMLILALGGGGFFGWKYFSAKPAPAARNTSAEGNAPAEAETTASAGSEGGERGSTQQSTLLNFEPFLVNLADRDASRYLRVTIRLQLVNKNSAEKIGSADVMTSQMRDAILGILTTRNSEQIITNEGKDLLKTEISEKLNGFLPGRPVKAVFFTDFVVQL